jgi:uncharacterized protein (DUF362 family)
VIDVFLRQASDYVRAEDLVPDLLQRILPDIHGARLLIKPNFVALRNAALSCTHPQIIRAAASYCRERGAGVVVGDSPAFGTAQAIARAAGLDRDLALLGIEVTTLTQGRKVRSGGIEIPVARQALDADLILNLPKLKAHSQMRLSGAVKNLFGCVPGVHKAWLHAAHGDKARKFPEMISGLLQVLPPVYSLVDGIEAMHRTGPIAGDPYPLHLLGASSSAVALDTAAGMILRLGPEKIPVWQACQAHGLLGAETADLAFPLCGPADFDAAGFLLPDRLKPESFRPDILLRSLVKRWWLSRLSV